MFGTFDYGELVARWRWQVFDAGCRDSRIVRMDDRLPALLREECAKTRAVAHRALLPNVPWADVDAVKRQRLKAPTPMRGTSFRALAEYGIDFIHSDACWLAGPATLARRAGRLRPARLPGDRTREGTVRRPWFRALRRAFPVPRQSAHRAADLQGSHSLMRVPSAGGRVRDIAFLPCA